MKNIPISFDLDKLSLHPARILASKKLPSTINETRKYRQILASIREIGLIEPLSVSPVNEGGGLYLLLDGHIRLIALKELGWPEVPCLLANDDEGYTYNSQVNRLSAVQEHQMIRKALDSGLEPERLARALSLDIKTINHKANLLQGICPEAVTLLKDRNFSIHLTRVMRKMKSTRQIECAELMTAANNFSMSYINALLIATPSEMLVEGKTVPKASGVTPEDMALMEREMASLQNQYKMTEESYGQDVMKFVVARGYLAKLLANPGVVRYLNQNHPELIQEFSAIAETSSLD